MSCTTYNSHRPYTSTGGITTSVDGTSFEISQVGTATSSMSGGLQLFPDPPTFGLLCTGYRYRLVVSVFNSGKRPQRLRVTCSRAVSSGTERLRSRSGASASALEASSLQEEDGKATMKEQIRLVKLLKKRLTHDGGSYVAIARKFRAMDLDGNGVIDIEEFRVALTAMDLCLPEEKIINLFSHFDIDGSGEIDIEEFIAGIREPTVEAQLSENKITCNYEPTRLAPGMRTTIELEIAAELPGVTQCELTLFEAASQTEIVRTVKAYVLQASNYKILKKHLELNSNNPEINILAENVRGIGKLVSRNKVDNASYHSSTSVGDLEDGNLDDDEIDEIMGMPIVHGVYYDRWKKVLKCDPDLLKVVVNPEWTLQECIEEADTHYGERFFELEKKGMFSSEYIATMNESKSQKAASQLNSPFAGGSFSFGVDEDFCEPTVDQSSHLAVFSLDSQDQLFQTTAGGGKM